MRPINLLPPEAFQRQKSRQLLTRIAILGAAYLLLLVLLTILWSGRVGRAQDALDSQEVENAALQAQIVELQPVGVLVTQYEEDAALIESALVIDISWGRVLNDLGRVIPDRVWLDGFAGSASPDEETGAVGLMQTSGTGFAHQLLGLGRIVAVLALIALAGQAGRNRTKGLFNGSRIGAHEDRIPDPCALSNQAAQTDDRIRYLRSSDAAAVCHEDMVQAGVYN